MSLPVYNFANKSAVVTGAGGGMGEAIALALSQGGAMVTAVDETGGAVVYGFTPCSSISAIRRSTFCVWFMPSSRVSDNTARVIATHGAALRCRQAMTLLEASSPASKRSAVTVW